MKFVSSWRGPWTSPYLPCAWRYSQRRLRMVDLPTAARAKRDAQLAAAVVTVHQRSRRTHGSPCVHRGRLRVGKNESKRLIVKWHPGPATRDSSAQLTPSRPPYSHNLLAGELEIPPPARTIVRTVGVKETQDADCAVTEKGRSAEPRLIVRPLAITRGPEVARVHQRHVHTLLLRDGNASQSHRLLPSSRVGGRGEDSRSPASRASCSRSPRAMA